MRRLGFLPVLWMLACGDDEAPRPQSSTLSPNIERVSFEVDYQTGAEPYTFSLLTAGGTWQLFRRNVEAVYDPLGASIDVPESLEQMQSLGPSTATDYSAQDILAIAEAHRESADSDTTQTYYIVFLDGLFRGENGPDPQVIGVSIGDTGVIAMFKPVYDGQLGASFLEQTSLIHEFGHAVGLVNRTVALTSNHHDAEHGNHCTNQQCVMFWQNEGLSDLLSFVQRYIFGDDTVVFGPECLADINAEIRAAQGNP